MLLLNNQKGITIVELMVSILVGIILIAGATATYIAQQRSFVAQENVSEVNTQPKIAMSMMVDDIRNAGFGAPTDLNTTPINGTTSVISSVDNNAAPDSITIVSGFVQVGTLTCAVNPFDLNACGQAADVITLNGGGIAVNDVISFDGIESAVVTAIAGNNITLDQNLTIAYLVGRPVYLVDDVTYAVDGANNLTRDGVMLAENVEDLQLAYAVDADNNGQTDDIGGTAGLIDAADFANAAADPDTITAVRINILATTGRPDPNAVLGNPPALIENRALAATNDQLKRRWWQTVVTMRNR